MATVTLATLRSRVRERCDIGTSGFVTDTATSLDALINESAQLLHDILAKKLGDAYLVSSSSFSTSGSTVALPSDFYHLLGVDLTVGGVTRSLKRFMFRERNAFKNASVYTGPLEVPRYALEGTNIRLYPQPSSGLSGTFWYVPLLQVSPSGNLLVNGTDSINFPNGWEVFIVVDAAMKVLAKEESDTSALDRERSRILNRIEEAATDRDLGAPHQAVDVESADIDLWWP